jgi:murein L,D-transpeptidase YafK
VSTRVPSKSKITAWMRACTASTLPHLSAVAKFCLVAVSATAMSARAASLDDVRARAEPIVKKQFAIAGLSYPPREVFIRAFKQDEAGGLGRVEVWARSDDKAFVHIVDHRICAMSGAPGPKAREGDEQVPEGVYVIDLLNPHSNYHLSMRVSYPNEADVFRHRAVAPSTRIGGAIMIHGNCVTIGCIPIEDGPIEELYVTVASVFGKTKPVVHVFPRPLTEVGLASLQTTTADAALLAFWRDELAPVFRAFEATHTLARVRVVRGRYALPM